MRWEKRKRKKNYNSNIIIVLIVVSFLVPTYLVRYTRYGGETGSICSFFRFVTLLTYIPGSRQQFFFAQTFSTAVLLLIAVPRYNTPFTAALPFRGQSATNCVCSVIIIFLFFLFFYPSYWLPSMYGMPAYYFSLLIFFLLLLLVVAQIRGRMVGTTVVGFYLSPPPSPLRFMPFFFIARRLGGHF